MFRIRSNKLKSGDGSIYIKSTDNLMVKVIFLIVFMLPIDAFEKYGISIDLFVFSAFMLVYILYYILQNRKLKYRHIYFMLFIVFFSFIDKSLYHVHLIGIIIVDLLISNKKIKRYILNRKTIILSISMSVIYSILYFGEGSRYIYTGLKSPNQSGLALFMLFSIVRTYNKKVGNVLLLLGLLSFSKSYLLALIIVEVTNFINKRFNFKIPKNIFIKLGVLSIILLVFLSSLFNYLYNTNNLSGYATGLNRYITIFDYSNYHRFNVNTNLLKIYINEPNKLLTGLEFEEFYEKSREISLKQNTPWGVIKPHNYFFSYILIYGIFSIIIFAYINKIFNQIICKENLGIFLAIFSYITFLGMGVSSYLLFLSVFVMIAYYKTDEGECNV